MASPKGADKRVTSKVINSWHERALKQFEPLLKNDHFLKDINILKEMESRHFAVCFVLAKYHLTASCYELVDHYFETGELSIFVMRSPVYVVSELEDTALPVAPTSLGDGKGVKDWLEQRQAQIPERRIYLELDPECTRTDIETFILDWWSQLAQPRLDKARVSEKKRVEEWSFSRRDNDIYNHVRVEKKPAKDIAEKYGISPEYARIIAHRVAKRMHNT